MRKVAALALGWMAAGLAQAPNGLLIGLQLDRLYPSTVVVYEIRVASQTTAPLPLRAGDYEILVSGKTRPNAVLGFRPARRGGRIDPSVVFLRVPSHAFKEGEMVQVRIAGTARASAPVKAPAAAPDFSVTLGPNYVQSQALKNGQKRPLGQLEVVFDQMTLTPSWMWARTYLKTDSVISTDAKDKKSDVNLALGLERSVLRRWYLPFHAETKMDGDQVGDNLSSVSSAGISSLVPWGWTRSFLRNPVLEAPVSPDFGIDAQFERRIRQDAASRKSFFDKNAFRLHPHSNWTAMRLLKGSGAGDPVELEIAGSGWYLPHQHTGGPKGTLLVDRLEGLLEVSVLVPVSKLSPTGTGITTPQKGTKSMIRVKYSRGANEAIGFKHSSALSLGVEVTGAK